MTKMHSDSKALGSESGDRPSCVTPGAAAPHTGFLRLFSISLVIFTCFLAWAGWPDGKILGNTVSTDQKLALESLKFTKDWGVWMASIQTATLAAVGILAKDSALTVKFGMWQTRLMLATSILNTLALFFSAWLLTSTSSIAMRLVTPHPEYGYDYYNFSIWNFSTGSVFWGKAFSVGFVALCNHWFWALGIISFGLLTVSFAISRSKEDVLAATATIAQNFRIDVSRDAEQTLTARLEHVDLSDKRQQALT